MTTIEEFLDAFDAAAGGSFWHFCYAKERLRTGDIGSDDGYFCPITFVAFQQTGVRYRINSYTQAAEALGLTDQHAIIIANAADSRGYHNVPSRKAIRARLLRACSLPPEETATS